MPIPLGIFAVAGAGAPPLLPSKYTSTHGSTSPFVAAYPWNDSTGFGSVYSINTSGLDGNGQAAKWNPQGNYVVTSALNADYMQVYAWSAAGFGTKTYAGYNQGVYDTSFNKEGTALAFAPGVSSGIRAFAFSPTTGIGSQLSSAGSNHSMETIQFSPDSQAVFFGGRNPNVGAYRWTNAGGYGTQYSQPASVPGSSDDVRSATVTPTASAVSYSGARFGSAGGLIFTYPWNSSTGFGTRYTAPTDSFGNSIQANAFTNKGDYILATNYVNTIAAWPWTNASGFGTRLSQPATAPTTSFGVGVTTTKNDSAVSFGMFSSPFIQNYVWNNGFGSKYSNPATLPYGGNKPAFD
jgi:hypothetical protein